MLLEFNATDTAWMVFGAGVFTLGTALNAGIIAILLRVDRSSPSVRFLPLFVPQPFAWMIMQASHRLLISLACADGILSASQGVAMYAHLALGRQSTPLCRFAGVFFPITGCQALLSLGIIAIDRFYAVVRFHKLAYAPMYAMLAVTWCVCACAAPIVLFQSGFMLLCSSSSALLSSPSLLLFVRAGRIRSSLASRL